MIIGIDASNLLEGGGLTHIVEILLAADPLRHGFRQIVIWSVPETLEKIEDRPWLVKRSPRELSGGVFSRARWLRRHLAAEAKRENCDLLFAPGGTLVGSFCPSITMSRNMLPFDRAEVARYGHGLKRLRLELLRVVQARSFRRAQGLIFLTDFARSAVIESLNGVRGKVATIPHGVGLSGISRPDLHRQITDASDEEPFRLVYVSHASPYKHQRNVIHAVAALRAQHNWPVALDMIGPRSVAATVREIEAAITECDPEGSWARFWGPIERSKLGECLSRADVSVFASSCENMPNVLLEKMAAGVPLACSDRGPMPEILQGAGEYFDPESSDSITAAIEKLVRNSALRKQYADHAKKLASKFSWERCADETFSFLTDVADATAR